MLELGKRLRHLYIDQLNLLPGVLTNPDIVYFRSSPFPRALESLQHLISGFLPPGTLTSSFGDPQIVMRDPREETLLPNEDHCERFIQICKAFSRRTADRCESHSLSRICVNLTKLQGNDSADMKYLNELLRKSMPTEKRVAVDSTPSMHAIHDAITATAATGSSDIRLPEEFYDPKVSDIVDKIAFEEEYSAFQESQEMRRVGIGALLGDVVERMVFQAERQSLSAAKVSALGPIPKLFLCGSHDSTLAAIVASLGAIDTNARRKWPTYGSVIAIELFQKNDSETDRGQGKKDDVSDSAMIGRRPSSALDPEQKRRLESYYVRVRYNDQSLVIPGCRGPGRNWHGNEEFCTLVSNFLFALFSENVLSIPIFQTAFKEIVDRFTPTNWRQACLTNLDKSGLPDKVEAAGY